MKSPMLLALPMSVAIVTLVGCSTISSGWTSAPDNTIEDVGGEIAKLFENGAAGINRFYLPENVGFKIGVKTDIRPVSGKVGEVEVSAAFKIISTHSERHSHQKSSMTGN